MPREGVDEKMSPRLLLDRSHSVGEEVMRTTERKRRYSITLPKDAMEVLRWHVDTQPTKSEQEESDLLFPGELRWPRAGRVTRSFTWAARARSLKVRRSARCVIFFLSPSSHPTSSGVLRAR
jgi:hypothetical protein